jgi:hypothetical protein
MSIEHMNAEQFALWLNGYLAGRPDMGNTEIREQLAVVIGVIVKRKMLDPARHAEREFLDAVDKLKYAGKTNTGTNINWPLPPPTTQPAWVSTGTGTAGTMMPTTQTISSTGAINAGEVGSF